MKPSALGIHLAFLLCASAQAHEGHDTPGALPPPPNGGRMAEAAHRHEGHGSEGEGESAEHEEGPELFLEAKYEGTNLKIFAHLLEASNTSSFKPISPGPKLSLTDLKIELPRSKRSFNVKVEVKGDHWEADTGQFKDLRFLAYPTVSDGNEPRTARIQIEK